MDRTTVIEALWMALVAMAFVWAWEHRNDVDDEEYFKSQWRFIVWFVMVCLIPFTTLF